MTPSPDSQTIAQLNDAFRKTFSGGQVVVTPGIQALSELEQRHILAKVSYYGRFDEGDDPYGEHDFGWFYHTADTIQNQYKVYWKIDYYDLALQYHSENPADPARTRRVLTVMLAEEY